MAGPLKATTEEIVAAYTATGSVWAAGKRLGICGQSVHERLVAVGHRLQSTRWTTAEIDEMTALHAAGVSMGEVARRLGRPYGGTAVKAGELGLRFQGNRPRAREATPPAFTSADAERHMSALESSTASVTQYARAAGLRLEGLVQACERHTHERWSAYIAARSMIPERQCLYCGESFVPSSGKQRYHSRQCASTARADRDYFGGRRRETVGLDAGICQLCEQPNELLSSHHVLGKENDPESAMLIALCRGCHQLVGHLAGRPFINDPDALEALIQLAWIRHNGSKDLGGTELWVHVDMEHAQTPVDEAP